LVWQRGGLDWHSLSRLQQWRQAWIYGPRELVRTLQLLDVQAFLLSLVFMGATLLVGALRWQLVMKVQGLFLPASRLFSISLVAQFFNAFLLGSTGGDLLKAYYAARETHHQKTEAVVTVVVDRLLGLFSMLSFAGVMMIPNFDLLAKNKRLGLLAITVLLMALACAALLVLAFWGGVSRHLPQARPWLRRLPKGELLERSIDACRRFGRSPRFLLWAALLSMLLNVFCVLQLKTIAAGLGIQTPASALWVIVPMIICISALPITPSGLGVRENLFVVMLAAPQIHVEATKALSLSLLAYAGFLFWSVVGGIVYLSLRERQHLTEVAAPTYRREINGGDS
jgi:glycosyltransferase 2 family protein